MGSAETSVAGLALLYHDNTVLAYVLVHAGNDVANGLVVIGTDSSHMLQLLLGQATAPLAQLSNNTVGQCLQLPQVLRLLGIIQRKTALHQSLS